MNKSTPMLDRLKAHLESITPEQFDAEIDDIIKNDTSVMLVCDECGMEMANCKCVFTCEMEDCPHCAYEQQQRYEEELEKEAAIDFAKWLAQDWMSIWVTDKWMWECQTISDNKELIGYKTEEELYEIYLKQA